MVTFRPSSANFLSFHSGLSLSLSLSLSLCVCVSLSLFLVLPFSILLLSVYHCQLLLLLFLSGILLLPLRTNHPPSPQPYGVSFSALSQRHLLECATSLGSRIPRSFLTFFILRVSLHSYLHSVASVKRNSSHVVVVVVG